MMKRIFVISTVLTVLSVVPAGAVSYVTPHDGGGSAADARFAQNSGAVLHPDYHFNLPTATR